MWKSSDCCQKSHISTLEWHLMNCEKKFGEKFLFCHGGLQGQLIWSSLLILNTTAMALLFVFVFIQISQLQVNKQPTKFRVHFPLLSTSLINVDILRNSFPSLFWSSRVETGGRLFLSTLAVLCYVLGVTTTRIMIESRSATMSVTELNSHL